MSEGVSITTTVERVQLDVGVAHQAQGYRDSPTCNGVTPTRELLM